MLLRRDICKTEYNGKSHVNKDIPFFLRHPVLALLYSAIMFPVIRPELGYDCKKRVHNKK